MYHSTTKAFRTNRLKERARNTRRAAKTLEEIAYTLEGMLTGEGDIRDEVIYDRMTDAKRDAQEMWDDHNDAIKTLKEVA